MKVSRGAFMKKSDKLILLIIGILCICVILFIFLIYMIKHSDYFNEVEITEEPEVVQEYITENKDYIDNIEYLTIKNIFSKESNERAR
jgi:sensor domain CHASE-containing protein